MRIVSVLLLIFLFAFGFFQPAITVFCLTEKGDIVCSKTSVADVPDSNEESENESTEDKSNSTDDEDVVLLQSNPLYINAFSIIRFNLTEANFLSGFSDRLIRPPRV